MLIKTIFISILLFFSNLTVAKLNIQHWESENGARIYFIENHDLPIVDLGNDTIICFPESITIDAGNASVAGALKIVDDSALAPTNATAAATPKYVNDYYLVSDFSTLTDVDS